MQSIRENSTNAANLSQENSRATLPAWRQAGLRYYSYGFYLRQRYGTRVQRVSVDAGLTCPNVDGTVALGGCTFCDNRSFSPSRRIPRVNILEQIDEGIRRLKWRYPTCERFMAYFQPGSNTYGAISKIQPMFEAALNHPQIIALAVGTRPDCVPDEMLALLTNVAARTHLTVEYGMQTMHDRSLVWMNRGHDHQATIDAMQRSVGRGFELCAHIMLGLPGESRADMLASAREVARLGFDAVKIHNLYAVHGTPLAKQVQNGEVELIGRDDYVSVLVDFLELLPPSMVVERVSGDAPDKYFLGPTWCLDKPDVLRTIAAEFTRRDSWQGKQFGG